MNSATEIPKMISPGGFLRFLKTIKPIIRKKEPIHEIRENIIKAGGQGILIPAAFGS